MSITPQKVAFYYSWPSLVNGSNGDVSVAVDTFKNYQLLVFGQGLEDPIHPDYNKTVQIINHPDMSNTLVFGYIDSVLNLDDIQTKIDMWATMGVKGIFMDKFGYDFGVTREKQRSIVWSIHHSQSGNTNNFLKAFVNAWNPDDVFASDVSPLYNPNGKETRLNENDWYLAESFAILNGNYDDNDLDGNGVKDWQDKATKMVSYRNERGTKLAAVTTTDNSAFDQNKADYSYYAASANGLDAWGWGEENFSASSASLPFRERPVINGTSFTSEVTYTNGVLQRQTNVGINIDTVNHTVSTYLN